jgi:hypothetical protein
MNPDANREANQPDYITRLIGYFRTSVLDSERLSPNTAALMDAVKKPAPPASADKPFSLDSAGWLSGNIDLSITEHLFKLAKAAPQDQVITLIIMPRVDLVKINTGKAVGKQSPLLVPLVTETRLNRDGKLKPSSIPPFVPREWLAPNQSDQVPFAEAEVLDQFQTLNPFNVVSWQEMLTYCARLLRALTTGDPQVNDADPAELLNRPSIHPDYQLKPGLMLAILEPPIRAGFHIVNVLDALLTGTRPNALLQKLLSPVEQSRPVYTDLTASATRSRHHVAQMTGEFPLADKQRNALHHLTQLADGELLAVNGPPGTGKTTLLRSVVANLWVQAALGGKISEPPLIVATSSNNQAVTNILESFATINETGIEPSLQGRWLPKLETYGLYACGSNLANGKNPYAWVTKNGGGIMETLKDKDSRKEATVHFLQAFQSWYGQRSPAITSVAGAATVLHQALCECVKEQHTVAEQLVASQQLQARCKEHYGSKSKLQTTVLELQGRQKKLQQKKTTTDTLLDSFLWLWRSRPFWQQIFSFLPWIKNRWRLDNELLLRKHQIPCDQPGDAGVRSAISRLTDDTLQQLDAVDAELQPAITMQEQLQKISAELHVSLQKLGLPGPVDLNQLNQVLDTQLRFRAFKLATHYWEARWLLEEPTAEQPKTPGQRLTLYRWYAKLTPCMVSTFYMVPSFFSASHKDGDSWRTTPFVDAIDLLIVDEAGQALPHIAAASFALARKALLVGDVYQIEPVWSLTAGIDRANLQRHHLLSDTQSFEHFWLPSALLASSGNLMRVAQRQVTCHQFPELEPGLYLTEHRRCYDSIIHYCNQLVYKGYLEPMRGNPTSQPPLPLLGFVHHDSNSSRAGSSRVNQEEAKWIVEWIAKNTGKLSLSASGSNALAIITPFTAQAKRIKAELAKCNLAHIQVGTVHAFQGAEFTTVLFSSVYGSNDTSGAKFYDRGNSMLNVAVSRAKNSFLVFGHRDTFGTTSRTSPSGLLRSLSEEAC